MTIYSVRLAEAAPTVATSPVTLFTVPAGRRYIVRTITAICENTPNSLFFYRATGQVWVKTDSAANTARFHLETRLVLDAGESFGCISGAGNWAVSVHGYDLPL